MLFLDHYDFHHYALSQKHINIKIKEECEIQSNKSFRVMTTSQTHDWGTHTHVVLVLDPPPSTHLWPQCYVIMLSSVSMAPSLLHLSSSSCLTMWVCSDLVLLPPSQKDGLTSSQYLVQCGSSESVNHTAWTCLLMLHYLWCIVTMKEHFKLFSRHICITLHKYSCIGKCMLWAHNDIHCG